MVSCTVLTLNLFAYPGIHMHCTRLFEVTFLWIFCLTSSYSLKINSFKIYSEKLTIDSGCVALWCRLIIAIQKQCPMTSWGYCAMRRGQIQIFPYFFGL